MYEESTLSVQDSSQCNRIVLNMKGVEYECVECAEQGRQIERRRIESSRTAARYNDTNSIYIHKVLTSTVVFVRRHVACLGVGLAPPLPPNAPKPPPAPAAAPVTNHISLTRSSMMIISSVVSGAIERLARCGCGWCRTSGPARPDQAGQRSVWPQSAHFVVCSLLTDARGYRAEGGDHRDDGGARCTKYTCR
jgi:hypothetical protein